MPSEPRASSRRTTTRRCVHFLTPGPNWRPTPLRDLPALARELGIGRLLVKDESGRFGLNAFKLLGARFADRNVARGRRTSGRARSWCVPARATMAAPSRARRATPAAARAFTWRTMPSRARVDAIAGEGAAVIKVDGSYDDAVRVMEAEANATAGPSSRTRRGRDTSASRASSCWDTRTCSMRSIGGWRIAEGRISMPSFRSGRRRRLAVRDGELVRLSSPRQSTARDSGGADVGGLSASLGAGRDDRWPSPDPSQRRWPGSGIVRCRRPHLTRCYRIVDAFLAIDDVWSDAAMRALGRPVGADPTITAGASGAAALGGLLALMRERFARGRTRAAWPRVRVTGAGDRERRGDRSGCVDEGHGRTSAVNPAS